MKRWLLLPALAVVLNTPAPGAAGQAGGASAFDRVWSYATLYENREGGFIERIALTGRLQIDAARVEADQGDFGDILWRRFRLGFKTTFLRDWVLHVEGDWNLNEDLGESYSRLTDAYLGWRPGGSWGLKILKQSAGFTLDGATSSKSLLTLQRNNLTNNLWFTAEYFTGASISGTLSGRWNFKAGVFSSDGSDELSHFEAAAFTLLSLGYDLAGELELDNAKVRLDYVYNKEDADAGTRSFSQVLSLVTKWERGAWGLWTDLSAGKGYGGQSDLWGAVLMPFVDVTRHVQLVLRCTYLQSADENGVRLVRYETEVVEGRGDEYREVYGGLNVYFYGHKLKWQTGLKHAVMEDKADDGGVLEGWSISTGLRVSW